MQKNSHISVLNLSPDFNVYEIQLKYFFLKTSPSSERTHKRNSEFLHLRITNELSREKKTINADDQY